jgi:hypothetical protein
MSRYQFDNVGTEGMDSMNAALDGLDDSYCEWLMGQNYPDMPINTGEDLARAVAAGVGWDEFLESRK